MKLIEPEVVEADKQIKVIIGELSSSRKSIQKAKDLIADGKANVLVVVYWKRLIDNSGRGIRGNRGTRRERWKNYKSQRIEVLLKINPALHSQQYELLEHILQRTIRLNLH